MERIKALFVSEDVEYAATVAACMRSINVPADFTITSEFTDAYAKNEEFDIRIIDLGKQQMESYREFISDKLDGDNLLFLTDNAYDKANLDVAYKYSSLLEIADKIISKAHRWNHKESSSVSMKKCSIYAVCASKGGVGCSSIAVGIARDFALPGNQKVLYISIGDIHEERLFFEQKAEGNLKEYIYEYLYGSGPFYEKRDSYFNSDLYGVKSFNTSSWKNRFNELNIGELSGVLNAITSEDIFERIIVDVGTARNELSAQIKDMADRIIYVEKSCDTSLEIELKREDYDKYGDKMISVKNFMPSVDRSLDEFFEDDFNDEEKLTSEGEKLIEPMDIHIIKDDKAFSLEDGIVDIDISGDFGKGIRQLISCMASGFYI